MAHIRFETKKQSALPSPESINPRPVDRMLHPNDSIEEIAPNMLPDAGRNKTEIQCLSSTVCALHLWTLEHLLFFTTSLIQIWFQPEFSEWSKFPPWIVDAVNVRWLFGFDILGLDSSVHDSRGKFRSFWKLWFKSSTLLWTHSFNYFSESTNELRGYIIQDFGYNLETNKSCCKFASWLNVEICKLLDSETQLYDDVANL